MPNYWPLSSGNWSNLSNWLTANTAPFNAAVLPTATDDVFSNNRIIYIDGNYRVSSIRNISATNVTAGGFFVANNGITLSAYVVGGGTNDVACLQFLSAAPASATLIGNISAGDIRVLISSPVAFQNNGTGTFNIIGNGDGVLTNGTNTTNKGYIVNGSGTLNLTGSFLSDIGTLGNNSTYSGIVNGSGFLNLTGIISGGNSNNGFGLNLTSSSLVNIYGNVFGGRGGTNYGVRNSSTGTVNIFGGIFGGIGSNSAGIINSSTGTITVQGSAVGGIGSGAHGVLNNSTGIINASAVAIGGIGSGAHGVLNNSTGFVYVTRAVGNNWGINSGSDPIPVGGASFGVANAAIFGSLYIEEIRSGNRGQFPTSGLIYLIKKTNNHSSFYGLLSSWRDFSISSLSGRPNYSSTLSGISGFNFMFSSLSGDSRIVPPVSSIRTGVIYDFGSKTGTLNIPIKENVLIGNAVDNTFGTSIADASLVWVAPLSAFENTTNTLGRRVIDAITIENFGGLAATIN